MGLLLDGLDGIGRGQDDPSSAFDPRRPNHRGYADAHRMVFRIVRVDNPAIVVREHVLVVMPESYSRSPEARVTMHHTAGGHIVDIPAGNANGAIHYNINGTTGLWPLGSPRAVTPQIPDIGDLAALAFSDDAPQPPQATKPDGMAAIKAFADLITEYLKAAPMGIPRRELRLEFINPDEPIDGRDPAGDSAYIIAPMPSGVEIRRDARSPSLWRYSFRFVAYDRPAEKPATKLIENRRTAWWEDVLGIANDLTALSFDQLFAQYRLFIQPLTAIAGRLTAIRSLLEGWGAGRATFAGYHERLLAEVADDIRALTTDIEVTLGVSARDRWNPDAGELRSVERAARGLRRTAHGIGADPSVTNAAATDSALQQRPVVTLPEFATSEPQAQLSYPLDRARQSDRRLARDVAAGIGLPSPRASYGTQRYQVRQGDVLESFVPPGWTPAHIIALNNLRWPFVDGSQSRQGAAPDAGDPWVAYLGEWIQVPIAAGASSTVAGSESPNAAGARGAVDEDDRLFGVDFYVNADRNLELDPATGDVRLIGGTNNLFQALRHLLALPVGALHTAPSLGSYLAAEATGSFASSLQLRLNAIAARRTLEQDPRIQRVRSLVVSTANGSTRVACELDAINGRPIGRVALSV